MNIFDGSAISDRAAMNGWKDQADNLAKRASYLEQENSVLHEKLRKLEIKLAAEREACAKVAEGFVKHTDDDWDLAAKHAANSIAALIRGRG